MAPARLMSLAMNELVMFAIRASDPAMLEAVTKRKFKYNMGNLNVNMIQCMGNVDTNIGT